MTLLLEWNETFFMSGEKDLDERHWSPSSCIFIIPSFRAAGPRFRYSLSSFLLFRYVSSDRREDVGW